MNGRGGRAAQSTSRAALGVRRGAVCAALALCGAACVTEAPPPPDPRAGLRPAVVHLPPVPNLDIVDVPAVYDDGARSIAGIVRDRDALLGQPMRVTGVLHAVYVCEVGEQGVEGEAAALAADPDPGATVAVRPGCLRPHFHLVDNLRSRQRLLVTGYDAALYEPQLVPGNRYTVTGTYQQQTRGFISTEEGLLVATAIAGDGVVVPPPAEAQAAPATNPPARRR